jgi:hypothetical protein
VSTAQTVLLCVISFLVGALAMGHVMGRWLDEAEEAMKDAVRIVEQLRAEREGS